MSLAFSVIIGLTALALTTLFGLAFLIGGLVIGLLTLVGYAFGGAIGAGLGCALGAVMVLNAVRRPKAQKPDETAPKTREIGP